MCVNAFHNYFSKMRISTYPLVWLTHLQSLLISGLPFSAPPCMFLQFCFVCLVEHGFLNTNVHINQLAILLKILMHTGVGPESPPVK